MATPVDLRAKAHECRHLAKEADDRTRDALLMLADDYEAEAARREAPDPPR